MTATPTPTSPVEVGQTDREAAAAVEKLQSFGGVSDYGNWIAAGGFDGHHLVQAFARHRLASSVMGVEAMREACAQAAYQWWDGEPEDAVDLREHVRKTPLPAAPCGYDHSGLVEAEPFDAARDRVTATTDAPAIPAKKMKPQYPDYLDDPDGLDRFRRAVRQHGGHDMADVNYNSLGRLIDTIDRLARERTPTTHPERSSEVELLRQIVEVVANADSEDCIGSLDVDIPRNGYPRQWLRDAARAALRAPADDGGRA